MLKTTEFFVDTRRKHMHTLRNRTHILILLDILAFEGVYWASVVAALYSSTSFTMSATEYVAASLILLAAIFAARLIFSVYHNVWRYANSRAYLSMVGSDCVGGAFGIVICYLVNFAGVKVYFGFWQMVAVVCGFMLATLVMRFVYQQRYRHLNMSMDSIHKIGIAIVGAGTTGAMLAQELLYTSKSRYKPICFIDINKEKIGSRVCGVPVLAEDDDIVEKIKKMPVQEIIIALPELDSSLAQRLINFYHGTGCQIKIYDFPFKAGSDEQDTSGKR